MISIIFMSRDIWDPQAYAAYVDERSRPFFDLVQRIGAQNPAYVVDAGCGSGELTRALKERWPGAEVHGFDASTAMIARAGQARGVRFEVAEATAWRPERPVDVLVSNALLQWIPDHRDLLERWVGLLASGGWLAFQVPGNFEAESHRLIRELCRQERWRDRLGELHQDRPVDDPREYLDRLAALGCRVDVWETTYTHLLQGEDAVLKWVYGTALRPILDRLDGAEAHEFTRELGRRLNKAYPRRAYGTAFPFRRIFVVAEK